MLVFRLFLLFGTSLIVYTNGETTLSTDLSVSTSFDQHHIVKDASGEDRRQGRMSLHAELPASKAKREQALRDILAARRRQILGQRLTDQLRNLNKPRPRGSIPKDIADVLEVQESRHGIYITAPVGVEAQIAVEEEPPQTLTRTFIKTASSQPELTEDDGNSTSNGLDLIKQIVELKGLGADNGTTRNRSETRYKSATGSIPRTGYSFAHRNVSTMHNQEKMIPAKMTQNHESEMRKNNNTVPMSESIYKHFRPVESDVPVEDMTQFLYFGQKLRSEMQNTTSSNSLEVTPTQTPLPSPRRRFYMKRFSTTTPIPMPKLEEIINEEMNIAVERPTVERNKMTRIKNVYRSPSVGSLYYRKNPGRPIDATIASNVINVPETKNITESDTEPKSETVPRHEEVVEDPSAHASQNQVRHAASIEMPDREIGSSSSHEVTAAAENVADDLTQLPKDKDDRNSTGLKGNEEMDVEETRAPKGLSEISAYPRIKEAATTTTSVDDENSRSNSSDRLVSGSLAESDFTGNVAATSIGNEPDTRVVNSSSDLPDRLPFTRETSTTLRIIVQETSTSTTTTTTTTEASGTIVSGVARDPHVEKPVNSSTSIGAAPPVALLAQQHVYAYTITNVTRLLRNYSGPGVSSREEGEQQQPQQQQQQQDSATAGTAETVEINGGSPSGIVVATRSRSDLSAGSAAEGVTALVGERANYDGDYVPASKPDTASRGATSTRTALKVNKSVAKVASRDSEVGGVRADSEVRKSSDIVGSTPLDLGDVDQRMLQKSASAVLNQRPSDRPRAKGVPRRHQSRGPYPRTGERLSKDQRRTTTTPSGTVDDSVFSETRPKEEPDTSTVRQKRPWNSSNESVSAQPTDNVVARSEADPRHAADPRGINGKRSFEEASDNVSSNGSTTGDIVQKSSDMTDRVAPREPTARDVTTMPPSEPTTLSSLEMNTDQSSSKSDGEDEGKVLDYQQRAKATVTVGTISAKEDDVAGSSNDPASDMPVDGVTNDGDEIQRRDDVARTRIEAIPPTSTNDDTTTTTTTTTTTVPSSVTAGVGGTTTSGAYPGGLDGESNTVTVDESTTEVSAMKTTSTMEADRPFGIAKDLSPSEIQQMYRSSNNTKVESTTSVNLNSTTAKSSGDSGPSAMSLNSTTTTSENWNGEQRTVNVERSPEVRGRNLSDKTRDKDDVLPIMQLYNTSSIFNGTSPIEASPSSRVGERQPQAVLPVAVGTGEKGAAESATVVPASDTTTSQPSSAVDIGKTATTNSPSPVSHDSQPSILPESVASYPENDSRRKDDSRLDEPVATSASASVKGANAATSTATRTRFKQPPHPIYLPNFNNSDFDPASNRTLLESRILSPRDPVNISEVISTRHEGDTIVTHETVTVVSYILATLVVFPIAVGVGLILRRLIIKNRKMLEESDTSSEISCRKKALNLENGDFKTSIEKAITKLPRIQHLCHEVDKPPPSPPAQESRWEFPRDKLRLQTVLGQGNFGQVWKAEADNLTGHQGTTRLVAVKTVKEGASSREKEDLVRELEIMQQLGNHPNVVTLLGCCTEEEPHYLILEYVMYGKLLAYLRDHRTRQDFYNFSEDSAALTSRDLTVFGYCVARGMEYLASKKIIHRDLAARNVLVDHNKLCKIADFGMSRFANEDGEVIETRHGRNALPIRWMAPESLIYSLFTTKTDVWSFGILMWEIVTLGSTPYPDMTAREVMRNVQNGYRLERPSHCRGELFRVISRCWHADPDRRPEFQVLRRDLAQLLEDNMNGHYVDLESFASECTD